MVFQVGWLLFQVGWLVFQVGWLVSQVAGGGELLFQVGVQVVALVFQIGGGGELEIQVGGGGELLEGHLHLHCTIASPLRRLLRFAYLSFIA